MSDPTQDNNKPELTPETLGESLSAYGDDTAARQAVEAFSSDTFGLRAEALTPKPVSNESLLATNTLSDRACVLIARSVDLDHGVLSHELIKTWERQGTLTLPAVMIDDLPYRLRATRNDETHITHIDFARAEDDLPPNGFSIIRHADGPSVFLPAVDKPQGANPEDEAQMLIEATKWIDRYCDELSRWAGTYNYLGSEYLDRPPKDMVFPENIPDKLRERKKATRKEIARGAAFILALAGIGGAVLGVRHILKERDVEWATSHSLPEDVGQLNLGDTKPVSFGGSMDTEIVKNAPLNGGNPFNYTINNGDERYIYTNKEMELAPKGHEGRTTDSCEHITIENLGSKATARVAALSGELAQNLSVTFDRTKLQICNVQTSEDATVRIAPRQLFFEITDPEE